MADVISFIGVYNDIIKLTLFFTEITMAIDSIDHQLFIESAIMDMGTRDGENEYISMSCGSADPTIFSIDNFSKAEALAQSEDDNHYLEAYNRGYQLGAEFGALKRR